MLGSMRVAALVAGALIVSACSTIVPPSGGAPVVRPAGATPRPPITASPGQSVSGGTATGERAAAPTPAVPGTTIAAAAAPASATNAVAAGVVAGRDVASLGLTPENATRALIAFRLSCPSVQRRNDTSGLTQGTDWAAPCAAARDWVDSDALRFFATNFRTIQVADGRGHATGYYEPEIAGSRTRSAAYSQPIYAVPPDLVEVDLGQFSDTLTGKRIRGRVEGGRFVPYASRAQIDGGALAGRNLEIAWAADPVEFFFLQVQGSGRLRLPDGSVMRIGYAGQNGHDYVGIGRVLRDRGALAAGEATMQGIVGYLHRQSDGGMAVMQENPSWVFFRELTGPGPLGSLGVPVTARASVAADPAYIPLGAPVFLAFDRAEANGLWIAQDTGGAIKGANRYDTFWGAGDEARAIAGGMSARGAVLILLPNASVARLTSGG